MEFSRERGVIFIWGRLTILFCQKTVQAGYSSMQTLQKKKKKKLRQKKALNTERRKFYFGGQKKGKHPDPPLHAPGTAHIQ